MIWRFLSRVGKKQAGNALETFTQAVVAFDPETASEAQISLMEEELDKLGVRVGKAEQAVKKDHEETQALLSQYNRYMSAAERLEGQLHGRSPYLQSVHVDAPAELLGKIADVEIEAASRNALTGRLVGGERSAA